MRDKRDRPKNEGTFPEYGGEEQILNPEAPRFDTVAVVANSGRMLGSDLGEFIDCKDAVVRMNAAPTTGYEEDVGEKTTFRFVNGLLQKGKTLNYTSTPKRWLERVREQDLILMPLDQRSAEKARKMAMPSNTIYEFRDDFDSYINNDVKQYIGKVPSTGVLSTLFSLHIGAEVYLYGFGFHQEDVSNRHYWEDWETTHDGSHNWMRERALMDELLETYDNLHFHEH